MIQIIRLWDNMPGAIIGIYGQQRSGKTLISYKIAKGFKDYGKSLGIDIPVYTNLYTTDEDFIYTDKCSDFPLDLKPKIFLIDEIYNGCDAQDFRKLKEISIFINTIGKQNALLLYTSIEASMVYNRLRNQTNIVILAKGNKTLIKYAILDMKSQSIKEQTVLKDENLFKDVNYDTNFIPVDFDWSMDAWNEKLKAFYWDNYRIVYDGR